MVTGSRDGRVSSGLREEMVVATRQGRWTQAEDGRLGDGTGYSPGHGWR